MRNVKALFCALPLSLGLVQQGNPAGEKPEPQWIWPSAEPSGAQKAWFRKAFTVAEVVAEATLWGSCDNAMEVFLNGERVAVSGDWTRPVRVDVSHALVRGANTLAASGRNEGGPAALWLELVLEREDGSEWAVVTDSTWQSALKEIRDWRDVADSREWRAPHSFGELGVSPWGVPRETVDGRPPVALAADEITLPAGFRAELLYSVPNAEEGSWVSMTIDDRGRVIASDQYGALYRFTPPPIGGDESVVPERIDVEIGEAHGLLHAFDSLYVVVCSGGRYPSGLYRVRDVDGDDRFDRVERLKEFEGSGEHGPHAVMLGPDRESLYVIAGNHTALPEGIARSRVTPVWGEDQLLPRASDPHGHAVGVMAPGGWVCRTDPDGNEWELVAAGMRNAYDAAFNDVGDLFTFDSDMEWDVGLPWYRPTRVLHLVSGADFGWRHGSGKWPEHYPDSLPGVVDVGLASPTGVAFGKESRFPDRYGRAFYVADWAYGTIYAVHLTPSGSTYTGTVEPFLSGEPLPVTDLAFGPDGAMYFTTGGRRTQSGLYRVTWGGENALARRPVLPVHGLMRDLRHRLESFHGRVDPQAVGAAWEHLDHEDRFIRNAARVAIEHQPTATWAERALAEGRPGFAVQALIALVRTGPDTNRARVLARLDALPLAELSAAKKLDLLRAYALTFIRMGKPDAARLARLRDRLEPLYPSGDANLDRELCRMLVYLESPDVARKSLALLHAAEEPADQIHYAFTLRHLARGWSLDDRADLYRWLNDEAATFEGGHSLEKYVEAIRTDATATLTDGERLALAALLTRRAEDAAAPVPAAAMKVVREWKMEDLVGDLGLTRAGRNFASGAQAYADTRCFECHRIAGEGGGTGPDLTGAAGRFSERDLLETILAPSKSISDQYQDTEILTNDGELVVGRVEREDETSVALRTLPPEEELVEVEKAKIDVRRFHAFSRMPEGLVDVLTREQILDLLAYVLSGGDESAPRFEQE